MPSLSAYTEYLKKEKNKIQYIYVLTTCERIKKQTKKRRNKKSSFLNERNENIHIKYVQSGI